MLPLRDRLDFWNAKIDDFLSGGDTTGIYHRCVRAALAEPATARLLGKREGVTPDAVLELMRTAECQNYVMQRCPSTALDGAVEKLDEVLDRHERAARETQWDWRVACSLILLGTVAALVFGGLVALVVASLAAIGVTFTLFFPGSAVWSDLRQSVLAAVLAIAWLLHRFEVGTCAARWGDELQAEGIGPLVTHLVRNMLGDDPDSLFIPEVYEWGLRSPRDPDYVVENGARRQLERKLSHMEDGTIAVCGPRGAGKTTLLEQSVEKAGFGVIIQAPATYTPYEFLLSLSVQLCEKFIRAAGYTPPAFARLSPARRLLRRARFQAKRLGRWSSFAVPAVALIALGLSASVRSIYAQYATSVVGLTHTRTEPIRDNMMEIWRGHAVVASVAVTIAGISWWRARHKSWLPRLLGRLLMLGSKPLGLILAWLSAASVLLDDQIRRQVRHLHHTQPETLLKTGSYTMLIMAVWCVARFASGLDHKFFHSKWTISLEAIFRPATAAVGTYLLYYLINNPQSHSLLTDPDNPLRLAGIMAGVLLAKAGDWRPRLEEPELVTQCRNHLYRLQTIQQSTHGLTTGAAAQILSLGTNHATTVSTVPPNYPELVEEFRNLLKRIAYEKAVQRKTVVIAIDEVDRLGTDTQALAFLGEIKAILGVPGVYYLISVAEDVGAAFVRRGLPHRDVTDSSLDDIIHVQPSTLEESRVILAKRSQTLKDPYVILAHALSGGILRDLLRYGLQIREIQDKTQAHELTDLSRHLILEELAETFAGFRTLLSKQQWTSRNSDVLASFRTLCGYLRDPCRCTEVEMLHTLKRFAFYSHGSRRATATAGDQPNAATIQELTSDARQLIDEASAYAYFSLTLLDIFSSEGLERRTRLAAAHGPDGDPERLADARQELGISPHSARPLIDSIRRAWSLPPESTTSSHIPPGLVNCPRHNRME